VLANIAVSDVARAREFYEGKLGLKPGAVRGDGGTTYRCADGTALHIYASPDNAGRSTATLGDARAAWFCDPDGNVLGLLTS